MAKRVPSSSSAGSDGRNTLLASRKGAIMHDRILQSLSDAENSQDPPLRPNDVDLDLVPTLDERRLSCSKAPKKKASGDSVPGDVLAAFPLPLARLLYP
eukprot:8756933-Alexandrium_andersonii.AAC.1